MTHVASATGAAWASLIAFISQDNIDSMVISDGVILLIGLSLPLLFAVWSVLMLELALRWIAPELSLA